MPDHISVDQTDRPHIVFRSVDGRSYRRLREPVLHRLDLEITERCNHSCRHCGINRDRSDARAMAREMASREILEILEDAKNLGCRHLNLTGGEPLLRPDFLEICQSAAKMGFRIRVFTNASLLNTDHIECFKKSPGLEKIEITLYGMSPSTYGKTTGNPGAFQSILNGIGRLKEHRIPFLLKFAVLPWNESDVPEFKRFADESGVRGASSYVLFFNKRVRRDHEAATANQVIEKLRISPEDAVCFMSAHQPDYLMDLPRFLAATAGPQGGTLFGCGAGQGSGAIDAYGRLTPCLLLKAPDFSCDLRRIPLKQAVTELFPSWRKKTAQNPAYLVRCGRCFLKSLCEQCPAQAWMEAGKIDLPVEYFCRVTHALAEYLGLLRSGERSWEVADWKERIRQLLAASQKNTDAHDT